MNVPNSEFVVGNSICIPAVSSLAFSGISAVPSRFYSFYFLTAALPSVFYPSINDFCIFTATLMNIPNPFKGARVLYTESIFDFRLRPSCSSPWVLWKIHVDMHIPLLQPSVQLCMWNGRRNERPLQGASGEAQLSLHVSRMHVHLCLSQRSHVPSRDSHGRTPLSVYIPRVQFCGPHPDPTEVASDQSLGQKALQMFLSRMRLCFPLQICASESWANPHRRKALSLRNLQAVFRETKLGATVSHEDCSWAELV